MKRLAITAIMSAGLFCAAGAQASFLSDVKPYVGGDYQYTHPQYSNIQGTQVGYSAFYPGSLDGIDGHVGLRFNRYLGAEFGYTWSRGTRSVGAIDTDVTLQGPTLDVFGHYPLTSLPLDLLATAGGSDLQAKAGANGQSATSHMELGFRFGGGLEYWVNPHFSARGLIRYQSLDFDGAFQNALIADIGLNYQF